MKNQTIKKPDNYCIFKQAKYTILKNGNRITSGSSDICKELASDSKGVASALMSFGMPKTCPVEKVSFPLCFPYFIQTKSFYQNESFHNVQLRKCVDGEQKIDFSKHKSLLPLAAGNIDISIDGTHDTVFILYDTVIGKLQLNHIFEKFQEIHK